MIATGDVRALVFSRESLESLRRFSPYLASQVLLNLCRVMSQRFEAPSRGSAGP